MISSKSRNRRQKNECEPENEDNKIEEHNNKKNKRQRVAEIILLKISHCVSILTIKQIDY